MASFAGLTTPLLHESPCTRKGRAGTSSARLRVVVLPCRRFPFAILARRIKESLVFFVPCHQRPLLDTQGVTLSSDRTADSVIGQLAILEDGVKDIRSLWMVVFVKRLKLAPCVEVPIGNVVRRAERSD